MTGTWKRKKFAAAYRGTYTQTSRANVALSYRVTDARRLALLVRTGHRYGRVKVYFRHALLSTVGTRGRGNTRVVELAQFSRPRTGMVRIVTSSGRTVKVDGLGVSERP